MFIYRLLLFFKLNFLIISLIIIKIELLYGQAMVLNNSNQTQHYYLIEKGKIEKQAKQFGFDTKSPHKFFTISIHDKKVNSLFP